MIVINYDDWPFDHRILTSSNYPSVENCIHIYARQKINRNVVPVVLHIRPSVGPRAYSPLIKRSSEDGKQYRRVTCDTGDARANRN